jgi:DNA-binding MarR family transcriptional regulator
MPKRRARIFVMNLNLGSGCEPNQEQFGKHNAKISGRICKQQMNEPLALAQIDLTLAYLYRQAYALAVAQNEFLGEALYTLAAGVIRRRSRTLSLTALSTLATLEQTGPRRLTDLAVTEEITQPSMTALVTQLEQLGVAERRRDPADARVVLVAITRAGRQLLRERRRAGAEALTELIDKLDEQDAAQLHAALPALRRLVDIVAQG